MYELILENKYRQVKCGLGVILSPSWTFHILTFIGLSSNLLVGGQGILLVRHDSLGGMKNL